MLAELLGLAPTTATRWASLASRDWGQYTAMRRDLAREEHKPPFRNNAAAKGVNTEESRIVGAGP